MTLGSTVTVWVVAALFGIVLVVAVWTATSIRGFVGTAALQTLEGVRHGDYADSVREAVEYAKERWGPNGHHQLRKGEEDSFVCEVGLVSGNVFYVFGRGANWYEAKEDAKVHDTPIDSREWPVKRPCGKRTENLDRREKR